MALESNINDGEWDYDLLNGFDDEMLNDIGLDIDIGKSIEIEKPDVEIPKFYQILVELENEEEMKKTYEKFQKENYKCRILIL